MNFFTYELESQCNSNLDSWMNKKVCHCRSSFVARLAQRCLSVSGIALNNFLAVSRPISDSHFCTVFTERIISLTGRSYCLKPVVPAIRLFQTFYNIGIIKRTPSRFCFNGSMLRTSKLLFNYLQTKIQHCNFFSTHYLLFTYF